MAGWHDFLSQHKTFPLPNVFLYHFQHVHVHAHVPPSLYSSSFQSSNYFLSINFLLRTSFPIFSLTHTHTHTQTIHLLFSQIDHPEVPPLMLPGHTKEVTAVGWCPTDPSRIVTCSDNNDLRLWRVVHGKRSPGEVTGTCESYSGRGNSKM